MTAENKTERREKIINGLAKAHEKMLEFKKKITVKLL